LSLALSITSNSSAICRHDEVQVHHADCVILARKRTMMTLHCLLSTVFDPASLLETVPLVPTGPDGFHKSALALIEAGTVWRKKITLRSNLRILFQV
jgi:hypothetical protein